MIRTKSCKICGEVVFSISSTCEDVEFICKNCNSINSINLGKYSTLENKCNSCSNDYFKIKINNNENIERIEIECTICKKSPDLYYVDKNGKIVDRICREMLIIQDNINIVNNNVSNLEERVEAAEKNLNYIKYEMVENLSRKVNENKLDINSINYDMSSFTSELSSLKEMIKNIEKSIMSSLYLFK